MVHFFEALKCFSISSKSEAPVFLEKLGLKEFQQLSQNQTFFVYQTEILSLRLGYSNLSESNAPISQKNEASISPNRFLPRLLTLRQRLQSFQIILCRELPFLQKYLQKQWRLLSLRQVFSKIRYS